MDWRWKALGYVAALILFGVIFIPACNDSGHIGAGLVCTLIVIAGFVCVGGIYIHNKEHGK